MAVNGDAVNMNGTRMKTTALKTPAGTKEVVRAEALLFVEVAAAPRVSGCLGCRQRRWNAHHWPGRACRIARE
jgi:hypothetical protein